MSNEPNPQSNKLIWEMSEMVYKQKKELDEKVMEIEKEKEQIQKQKEENDVKVKQLWEQSIAIHGEKERIDKLRQEIEARHKEITDSIHYAKRLQGAIMPKPETLANFLKTYFLIYKPKDIVAGDFYWFKQHEGHSYIAVADCTGHGVPGALVSIVCSSALNRALLEFGKSEPGEILDTAREIIIETFSQEGAEVKDGMDISLCKINFDKSEIKWSGANNALWILPKGENEISEIKPNKQPVGLHIVNDNFTTHALNFKKGDSIYLITDGLGDQFGGPGGKKFKSANLKKLILELKDFDHDKRADFINDHFENWKEGFEQVDDVSLMGIYF